MESASLNLGVKKMPRTTNVHRKTNETDIRVKLNLDGRGSASIATGIRFFDHMLELVARHGAVDLGGRPYCVVNAKISANRVGDFQVELMEDFFQGFAQSAKANVHLRALYGRSSHHQVEAIFKAFARALRFAVSRDKRLRQVLPSTKGLL